MRLNIAYINSKALSLFIVIYLYLTNSCIKSLNSGIFNYVSPGSSSFWYINIAIIARKYFEVKFFF